VGMPKPVKDLGFLLTHIRELELLPHIWDVAIIIK
jgi:hypothetical protein